MCVILFSSVYNCIFCEFEPTGGGFRSISAVDTAAAQRARVRAQYSNLARLKVTSGTASLREYILCIASTIYDRFIFAPPKQNSTIFPL